MSAPLLRRREVMSVSGMRVKDASRATSWSGFVSSTCAPRTLNIFSPSSVFSLTAAANRGTVEVMLPTPSTKSSAVWYEYVKDQQDVEASTAERRLSITSSSKSVSVNQGMYQQTSRFGSAS